VPNIFSLASNHDVMSKAIETFNHVTKTSENVQSFYQRISFKSELQKKIDKIALEMIGLKWGDEQLNKLYDIIKFEFDVMQRILEESQRRKQKTGRRGENEKENNEESKSMQRSLTEWIKK
jgi:Skp family chaperone for outer membrane proteins